jgi:nucleoside-diphosphate-sugar epimerase
MTRTIAGRILVTGCAGFIAARVSELLLDAGEQVVGVDNLNDAYDPRLKHWRLERLIGRTGFEFYEGDIARRDAVASWGDKLGPLRAVLNLAARAGVRASIEDPWDYFETNVTGTLNLLELCRRHGIGRMVLASTSSLYAGCRDVPFRESDSANCPLSPYAASKKGAEALAYAYHHLYGLDVCVQRYFTVYGPLGRPDMSIFRFVRQIVEREPLTVLGDGSQQRDFTYVDDIARGTIAGLAVKGFEVVNLGGSRTATINEVISQLERLVGRQAQVGYAAAHAADMTVTWADNRRAAELLGWQPRVALAEGLEQTVAWYLAHRQRAATIRL